MNTDKISMLHLSSAALIRRLRYRHGFPFIVSAVLAVVTSDWTYVFGSTSIWRFALLTLISTVFALLCGGRFRTFFITIAVTPPFLFILGWLIHRNSAMMDFPTKAVSEYFLYFVAAPILMVWMVAALVNSRERHA